MVADYAHQIENGVYDTLFRKIEPHSSWAEGSNLAWSVLSTEALSEAECSAHTVARSWLNSEIQKWSIKVDKCSKIRGLKDSNDNIIMALIPSKSPLT